MSHNATASRRGLQRSRPTFLARVATDDAAQLHRRSSIYGQLAPGRPALLSSETTPGTEEASNASQSYTLLTRLAVLRHKISTRLLTPFGALSRQTASWATRPDTDSRVAEREPLISSEIPRTDYSSYEAGNKQAKDGSDALKTNMPRKRVDASNKLGTFSGVFVPTSLNVLSILMFLRFGFILGQSGVIGMMAMLVVSYLIDLVTTLSISAIASNGTVRGGGAYYLISRSLGPEFGGSIGIVFYLGFVLNTGMNAVGLVDCLTQNFGAGSGDQFNWLPEGFWWDYLWASLILITCTSICLAGSSVFAKASNTLLAILLVSTFSIPLSALVMKPFESRSLGIQYTGLSLETLRGNLLPRLTRGAAGSQRSGKETYQDLFGILFPATGGIFAGASMSGDLKNPSKAIPKGTLGGLALTFFVYVIVILSMAATITRASFYRNVNVIQDTNLSASVILLGEFATSFFSSLMGVIGSAKLLQALARDAVLPGFSIFSQGTKKSDEPIYAILVTHIVAQLTMLCDINRIASFITMTYLMTFLVTNLACFLLKISSAPNFRPSFHYFNWQTAATGTIVSGISMFFVDGLYATGCVGILVMLFLLIHYTTPPKSWGDVSQSLIYHQVRKYLLRLRQEHVKYWRPQILLLVNDPRSQFKLIQFCNYMKKGALYVLGHVIVSQDFETAVPEARRQQVAWLKYIDLVKVKAFVTITISPSLEWGARNIIMNSGLGGMRPNIAVLGFYNHEELEKQELQANTINWRHTSTLSDGETTEELQSPSPNTKTPSLHKDDPQESLPCDTCRLEDAMGVLSYVTLIEDLLLRLRLNVAVAKGFQDLVLPSPEGAKSKKNIDLWPIQMSAEIVSEGDDNPNVLTTNFDTYTLILQLGCILHTVPAWKKFYTVRVAVFVEYESDVDEERARVKTLLETLRIEAEVLVFCLASGEIGTYEVIINGVKSTDAEVMASVEESLREEQWWQELKILRKSNSTRTPDGNLDQGIGSLTVPLSHQNRKLSNVGEAGERSEGLTELIARKRRHTMGGISRLGVTLGMQTHRLHPKLIEKHATNCSVSEESDSSSETDVFSESEDEDEDRANYGHDTFTNRGLGSGGTPRKRVVERLISAPSLQRGSSDREGYSSSPSTSHHHDSPLRRPLHPSHVESAPVLRSQAGASSAGTAPDTTALKDTTNAPALAKRPQHPAPGEFTSGPVPRTKVTSGDTPGPSIMFEETSSFSPTPSPSGQPRRGQGRSIYTRDRTPSSATGYPFPQSMPLCFNDLPCRAQHLILNELIQQQSDHTAVVFTTLPSPIKGTCLNEADSLRYLRDLEVLCQDLPPTLMVHSNSMTVTTNL